MAKPRVKWSLEADYIQACNCDAGCPCEFQAPPTLGNCEGFGAWRIKKGKYGAVALDGFAIAYAAKWPGPLHLGNGTGVFFVDERANAKQREALEKIVTGAAGGLPFEILPQTMSKVLPTRFAPFTFAGKGREQSVRIGDAAVASVAPIVNPVTGQPEDVKIDHKTGFIFQKADVVLAKDFKIAAGAVNFAWPGKGGFLAKVKYAN